MRVTSASGGGYMRNKSSLFPEFQNMFCAKFKDIAFFFVVVVVVDLLSFYKLTF